jgi:hypothetical protein
MTSGCSTSATSGEDLKGPWSEHRFVILMLTVPWGGKGLGYGWCCCFQRSWDGFPRPCPELLVHVPRREGGAAGCLAAPIETFSLGGVSLRRSSFGRAHSFAAGGHAACPSLVALPRIAPPDSKLILSCPLVVCRWSRGPGGEGVSPKRRWGHAAVVYQNKLFIFGASRHQIKHNNKNNKR